MSNRYVSDHCDHARLMLEPINTMQHEMDKWTRTLSIASTPGRKFLSTAYSSRLMGLVCVVLSLSDDCRTLPTAAPAARAFRSLLTFRASTARNAAAVPFLAALSSDLPASVNVPALLCWTPIVVVVARRHPQIARWTSDLHLSFLCPVYFVAITSATSFSVFSVMKAAHVYDTTIASATQDIIRYSFNKNAGISRTEGRIRAITIIASTARLSVHYNEMYKSFIFYYVWIISHITSNFVKWRFTLHTYR